MTTAESTKIRPRRTPWALRLRRLDARLSRASEWLNPILIKEARQALKSRQFVITFGLLLLAVWGWTAMVVMMLQTRGAMMRAADEAFAGYFLILEVPLLVIVPFSAFRSLASEREDGTYELVSITALNARQIVTGKLGSSLLQVMIYFSVLAPCIAFTYMLRGIDIITIGMTLAYTLLFSVGLIGVCLVLAAAVRSIHWQILASVVALVGLAFCAFLWPMFVFGELLRGRLPYDEPFFWLVNGCILSMILVATVLHLAAAAAELSFASDNRSTKLRVIMLLEQMVFVGWMMTLYSVDPDDELPLVMCICAAVFWVVMGGFMTGELPNLSPRVRRSLPVSFLGRMAFTWFNPGSGTGYVFAVTNLLCVTLVGCLCWLSGAYSPRIRFDSRFLSVIFLSLAYVAFYLGLGRLVLLGLRRVAHFGVVVALLVQALVASLGVILPLLLQTLLYWSRRSMDYTWLQTPNWGWTLIEAVDRRSFVGSHLGHMFAVYIAAAVMFVVNVVLAAKELRQLRLPTPQRVLEDDRRLRPPPPEPAAPKSPFDD